MEILRTKGDTHSNMSGFHTIESEYPDQIVTDSFRIAEHVGSSEDVEGNCYDWYEIDHHIRFTDKFSPYKKIIEGGIDENSDAILDVADLSDENSNSILDLSEVVGELVDRVEALEGGN